ncbi:MAG: hypothetical protein K2N35_01460 [Muribaculaceae bacterium]|nr:hypothetical protein [Muribaculaceae bacterium]
MKRHLLLAILSIINIVAIASSPKLASEKIFEDINLYDPSLSITIMERPDQTVKTLSFKNKPDLQKKIKKALDSDKEKAVSKSLVSDNGEISESIVIINEDEEIKIGLSNSRSKEVYFFMQKICRNNSKDSRNASNPTKATKATKTKKKTVNLKTKQNSKKSQTRVKSKKGRKNSQKSIRTLRSEQLIDNSDLIIINTYDSPLTEI